jgi:flagellar biosynthesis/type III secretory pathway protein FliH
MSLMTKLRLEAATGWPPGIYLFGGDVLRVGIVVASELPRDRTTLLIRLMAAGPLLTPAIEELVALPVQAHERTIAEPILLQFQDLLGQQPTLTADEQEVFMAMLKSWEETRAEGRAEGHAEGEAAAGAKAVLTILRVRGIVVPDAARELILAEKDVQQLMQLLEKAAFASSINDVINNATDILPDERALIITVMESWAAAKVAAKAETRAEALAQAKAAGRAAGRVAGRVDSMITVLRARGIAVPDSAHERIRSQKDIELLTKWYERAILASSIEDVFEDPT